MIPQHDPKTEILYMEDGEYKVMPRAEAEEKGFTTHPTDGLSVPPSPKRYSKRVLFGALTDAEYAIWEQVENQQTPRRQRMLREAVELNEADEDYPDLYMAMVAAFGQERADEVLAKAELP